MKTKFTKILGVLFIIATLFFSCKKEKETDSSISLVGNWNISKYDGQVLRAPAFGTFAVASTSGTSGTYNMVVSFNGINNNKEKGDLTSSDSNTKVRFAKNDGDATILSGGGTWTINTVDDHNLKMTSQSGLTLEMTK